MEERKLANSKWGGHKNIKKNAFTLIELLAIIVILAIIAVITIPIILNIIDNSRKGAAKDSAYGYKDAINKYYLGRLSGQSNYNMPDEECTINSNGYLVCPSETLEIQVSGSIPSGGAIELEKNAIKQACIKFGEYAVTVTNGTVGEAQKAACNGTIIGSNNSNTSSEPDTPSIVTAAETILNESGETKGYLTEEQLAEVENKATITKPVKIEHPAITENTATGETIPALTSYRYMGANPNNYIYFNCNSYVESNQSNENCEMWRIISIEEVLNKETNEIEKRLKITPDIAIDNLAWDDGSTHNGNDVNDWATSSLNIFLNRSYLNSSLASLEGIDTATGGKRHDCLNSATVDLIADSTWYLGGGNSSKITAAQAYAMERGNVKYTGNSASVTSASTIPDPSDPSKTIPLKVAIISPSDYGFASSECYSGSNLYNYHDSTCTSSNWMYTGQYTWILSPYSDNAYYVWALDNHGYVYGNSNTNNSYGVRPTVYLISGIGISETGTSSDPYKIIK